MEERMVKEKILVEESMKYSRSAWASATLPYSPLLYPPVHFPFRKQLKEWAPEASASSNTGLSPPFWSDVKIKVKYVTSSVKVSPCAP